MISYVTVQAVFILGVYCWTCYL